MTPSDVFGESVPAYPGVARIGLCGEHRRCAGRAAGRREREEGFATAGLVVAEHVQQRDRVDHDPPRLHLRELAGELPADPLDALLRFARIESDHVERLVVHRRVHGPPELSGAFEELRNVLLEREKDPGLAAGDAGHEEL